MYILYIAKEVDDISLPKELEEQLCAAKHNKLIEDYGKAFGGFFYIYPYDTTRPKTKTILKNHIEEKYHIPARYINSTTLRLIVETRL